MSRVLLISENEAFSADLKQQLELLENWEVQENYSPDVVFDAAVIDDDAGKAGELDGCLRHTPLFLLWSGETELPEIENLRVVRKPFRLETLLDTLHTALAALTPSGGELQLNGCSLNIAAREIRYPDGRLPVKLTEREVAILKYLYKSGGKIVGKAELLAEVWGYNPEATTHTVETHIYRLRQKIEQEGGPGQVITTRENGYKLMEPGC